MSWDGPEQNRRKASILNTMQQYGTIRGCMHRLLTVLTMALLAVSGSACASADSAPVVAAVDLTLDKSRAALGSPIQMDFSFDVRPDVTVPEGYRVMADAITTAISR